MYLTIFLVEHHSYLTLYSNAQKSRKSLKRAHIDNLLRINYEFTLSLYARSSGSRRISAWEEWDMTGAKNKISVIGLGFAGLSLVAANTRRGFDTIGVDIDSKKIERLKACRPDFFEPDMEEMLRESMSRKKVCFTTDIDYALQNSEITFLAVGTPLKDGGDAVDLSYVKNAIKRIAVSLRGKKTFHLLVVKSTLPPMTTESVILPVFKDMIEDKRMDVVVNPEFLREGFAIADILKPHLIVIGSSRRHSSLILEKYYRDFYETLPEIIHTSISTAEMIKYTNNAFLATKISFINSISNICQDIPGVDVNTIARAIGKDSRIGPLFLQAGPGFGGSCLPKDLAGLIALSQETGKASELFKAVKDVNDRQFMEVIRMVKDQDTLVEGNVVAVLGVAFKKGTDDIRDAVSVRVVEKLLEHKLRIRVHDPMALKNFRRIFGTRISYSESITECLEGSDCCIILTDWSMYKDLRQQDFLKQMRASNIIDARRILNAKEFQETNFRAIGLGR